MKRFKSIMLASLLALSAASQPLQASAQTPDGADVERFDSRKFADYAACAISVGFAAGTGGWLLAGLVCYRAFTEHWST